MLSQVAVIHNRAALGPEASLTMTAIPDVRALFFVFLLHQHLMVLRIYQMDPEAETPKVVMQAVVILNLETTVMEVVDVSIFYSRNHFYSFFSLAQCFSSQTEVRTKDLKANSKVVRLSLIFIAQCI